MRSSLQSEVCTCNIASSPERAIPAKRYYYLAASSFLIIGNSSCITKLLWKAPLYLYIFHSIRDISIPQFEISIGISHRGRMEGSKNSLDRYGLLYLSLVRFPTLLWLHLSFKAFCSLWNIMELFFTQRIYWSPVLCYTWLPNEATAHMNWQLFNT